jgi:hypothetical protein
MRGHLTYLAVTLLLGATVAGQGSPATKTPRLNPMIDLLEQKQSIS